MQIDFQETDGNKSRPENINELVSQTTLEQEAKDLMDSVLDHALFIEPEHPTTLPYLKVTSESIFYTHNRNLKYYYEISQKSLETVRRIIELLVPLQRIEKVCTLSIESLYQLLWTRNSSQDMYWTHFKTDKTEKLLKKLASYNNILIQPRRYSYCTADSRKITSSYATFVTLIDQILTRMEYIDALYSTRELQEIFIDISVQKYESRKLYDKEDNSVWDFGAFIPQMNEEIFEPSSKEETIGALEGETVQEIDSRQIQIQELVDRLVEISPSKKTVQEGKEKKRKNRKNDVAATLGKKWKKKSKQDKNAVDGMEEDEEGRLYGQQSAATVEMLGESSPLTRSAGSGSGGGTAEDSEAPTSTPPPPAVEEERSLATPISQRLEELPQAVQEQFQEETKRRIYQAKRMVFEDLLAKGIERIICAVDAFNAMEDYRQSEFLAKPNISTNYCCSD
ncbi:uncharacterized protein LOC118434861 [Folsomia candida]|uniref:uncharacterized protein LOC118434861 n=1 Tax=Folsomia candida TaxID=158441 RepID=UPI00160516A1|nr:uncharacterized protein LOC118434861 [Folsomia candida]